MLQSGSNRKERERERGVSFRSNHVLSSEETSRTDTTPEEMEATYSTYINQTRG
jgi:hypothetical protein